MIWPLLFLLTLLSSCKGQQLPPSVQIEHDSIYVTNIQRDSIYVHDSTTVVIGDTIRELRYRYIYKYKDLRDTLYIEKTDTLRIPYEVPAKLTKIQRWQMELGKYAMVAGFFIILIVVGNLIYKMHK